MSATRIPTATYRLQFTREFTFAEALEIVPYLDELGITDLYASPLFTARSGSAHGYDVTDPTSLNLELGGEVGFQALSGALMERGMGLLLDVVPNHMGISDPSNHWWQDVLENGPSSPYARFFDIDWNPPKEDLSNKVLLPVLGDQYGRSLEKGEIRLLREGGAFFAACFEQRFPLAPRTSTALLEPVLERLRALLGEEHPHAIELASIATSLRHLPPRTETAPEKVEERHREKEVAKRRLAQLLEECAPCAALLDEEIAAVNGRPGDPRSFDRLEALLAEQAYRLCYWRVAADEINYRRFFDINDLAAIRVEDEEVFETVHRLPMELVAEGRVTGLRIDHPDGLFDPEGYFLGLQEKARELRGAAAGDGLPLYLVVEKILSPGERLPERWAVHGTTGYEFLNLLSGLFVRREAERAFRRLYACITGRDWRLPDLLYEAKKLILEVSMSSELNVLARKLDRISEQHRWSRDFTLSRLQKALGEVIASFPVYRTYIRPSSDVVAEEDRRQTIAAVRSAKSRNRAIDDSVFDFIASVLLLEHPEGLSEEQRAERREFVLRFQQITGPVTAKGLEDTAFYRVFPLASLNEVGGDPGRFGVSLAEFHAANAARRNDWPHALSATSTHDSKRSEDVRARIDVLTEMPEEWEEAVALWRASNRSRKLEIEGVEAPDANEEYLLYQTLIGAWPLEPVADDARREFRERIERYMEKALKEAKVHTSWINPNQAYDAAVCEFVRRLLEPEPANEFLADFLRFQERVAQAGAWNSLAQTLIKITAPGVPDFYQGSELWSFSLVDPDNRAPVDYSSRRQHLEELSRRAAADLLGLAGELVPRWRDGRIKLFLTWRALGFRRSHRRLFAEGAYLPLEAAGARSEHCCAFARRHERSWALTAVPRFVSGLLDEARTAGAERVWERTWLRLPPEAPAQWRNVLTGELVRAERGAEGGEIGLARLFGSFPVALLEGAD
jgi:(1->4)-alpha-D-glucan 1-alpha-D-glucosylmutase